MLLSLSTAPMADVLRDLPSFNKNNFSLAKKNGNTNRVVVRAPSTYCPTRSTVAPDHQVVKPSSSNVLLAQLYTLVQAKLKSVKKPVPRIQKRAAPEGFFTANVVEDDSVPAPKHDAKKAKKIVSQSSNPHFVSMEEASVTSC